MASVHEDIEEEDQVKKRGSFKVKRFEAKSRVVAVFKDPKKVPPEPPPNGSKMTEVDRSKYCQMSGEDLSRLTDLKNN